ncbi:hypothetical protein D3C77_578350 [compost metagenome]
MFFESRYYAILHLTPSCRGELTHGKYIETLSPDHSHSYRYGYLCVWPSLFRPAQSAYGGRGNRNCRPAQLCCRIASVTIHSPAEYTVVLPGLEGARA